MSEDADVIVIGAGLAGLVAACEIVASGRRALVLDQEPEASLGGHPRVFMHRERAQGGVQSRP